MAPILAKLKLEQHQHINTWCCPNFDQIGFSEVRRVRQHISASENPS